MWNNEGGDSGEAGARKEPQRRRVQKCQQKEFLLQVKKCQQYARECRRQADEARRQAEEARRQAEEATRQAAESRRRTEQPQQEEDPVATLVTAAVKLARRILKFFIKV